MSTPPKIVIIGMGYIMEYLLPSYTRILGGPEQLAGNVLATTLDGRDLPARRQRLGFEVQLGDNPGALRRMKPDILLFAPPPDTVPGIMEAELIPYYNQCRAEGWPLPQLYAFPPSPEPEWYTHQLGEDVLVVVINPRTDSGVPGEELPMLTFGPMPPWEGPQLTRLMAFVGEDCEILSTEQFYGQLGARCVANSINETFFTFSDSLAAHGLQVSHSAMAAYGKTLLTPMAGTLPTPEAPDLPQALTGLLTCVLDTLQAAITQYLTGLGYGRPWAARRVQAWLHGHLDLCLKESRLNITRQIKCYATKGGIAELVLLDYGVLLEGGMKALFNRWPSLAVNATLEDWLHGQYQAMCQNATYRAATLHQELPLPEFNSKHMDRMMAYIRATTRAFAGDLAADVVLGAMAAWLDSHAEVDSWAFKVCGVYHAADRWLTANLDTLAAGDIISEARLAFGRRYGQGAAYLPVQMAHLFTEPGEA